MWHVCPVPGKPLRRSANGSGPGEGLRPSNGRRAGRVEDPARFGRQDTSRRRPASAASPSPQPGQPTRFADKAGHGTRTEARGTDRPRTPRCSPPRATAEGTDHAGNCEASAALERMQSPREYRAALRRQRRSTATDSSADQGLEAARRGRQTGSASTLVEDAGPASEPGINGEKATTAVNWTSTARNRRTRKAQAEATRPKPDDEGAETSRTQVTRKCFWRGEDSEGCSAIEEGPGPSEGPDVAEPRQAGFFGTSPAHSSEATGRRRPPSRGARDGRATDHRLTAEGGRKSDSDVDQGRKLGEPHDRFQGATNLKSARRSKPSQPGGTARAERVRRVAAPDRRQHRVERGRACGSQPGDSSAEQRCGWEWTPGIDADGGAISDNPKRGARIRDRTRRGEPKAHQSGERTEEGRARRAASPKERRRSRGPGHWSTRPHGAEEREVPCRPARSSPEDRARSRRARGEGQRSATRTSADATALRLRPQWRRRRRP
jgi:hypothetical protein